VHGLGQLEDLVGEVEQLEVLRVLLLDQLPLLVGGHLAGRVGSVLADHHERREDDRLQRDDHREQPDRVGLDAEADPGAEPDHVQVDERHRAREAGDGVSDPVLNVLGALLGVPDLIGAERLRQCWRYREPPR
jgi:hypothetical protein